MLFDLVMLGDLSAIADTFSYSDAIFVQQAIKVKHKYESEHQYVMLDVRFFLARLSAVFTGSEHMNFLPSSIHAMEERLEDN